MPVDSDQDALTIFRSASWLHGNQIKPDSQDVAATDVYMRGKELAELCDHECRREPGINAAGIEAMSALIGSELPSNLNDWTNEQLQAVQDAFLVYFVLHELAGFEQAWSRRLANLPFPIRVEGTRFLYRTFRGEWEVDEKYSAALAG